MRKASRVRLTSYDDAVLVTAHCGEGETQEFLLTCRQATGVGRRMVAKAEEAMASAGKREFYRRQYSLALGA